MKKKKWNLFIFILIGIIFVFTGERVEAALAKRCNYNFTYSNDPNLGLSSDVDTSYRADISFSLWSEEGKNFFEFESGTKNYNNPEISDGQITSSFGKIYELSEAECPDLYWSYETSKVYLEAGADREKLEEGVGIDFGNIDRPSFTDPPPEEPSDEEPIGATCEAILVDVIDIIQDAFGIIKIVAPILVIFFGSLDFAKGVISGDDKAVKKSVSDFGKRVLAAVAIFFIPFFIELLFGLPGLELGIKNIMCNVSKVVLR